MVRSSRSTWVVCTQDMLLIFEELESNGIIIAYELKLEKYFAVLKLTKKTSAKNKIESRKSLEKMQPGTKYTYLQCKQQSTRCNGHL